jgi:Domain of unknown function (DUF4276)
MEQRPNRGQSVVSIFMEGGGDAEALKAKCRRGLHSLIDRILSNKQKPKVVACGTRGDTFDRFRAECQKSGPGEFIILLVDSEEAVKKGENRWAFLKKRDGWNVPTNASEDQAQLMIQCMETWLIADPACLSNYFGNGFKATKLPKNTNLEAVSTDNVLVSLKAATKTVKSKGEYNKAAHSFDLLGRVDPDKLKKLCPSAKRFFDLLNLKC